MCSFLTIIHFQNIQVNHLYVLEIIFIKLTGKFKKVSLNDTTEFSFWGNYIFVDLHKEVDIKKRER